MRVTAVVIVRNEGAFLLEWLAHHRAAGVTDFLIFSNDCQDGTDRMLDRLQDLGWLGHLPNPGPYRGGVQWTALRQADRHPLVQNADWLITMDLDEFINVKIGNRTIAALVDALPQATAIPLTWRMFGNAGVVAFDDTPVTETFVQAAPEIVYWPWRAMMFKTLHRNDGTYRRLGIHRPRKPDPDRLDGQRWFDGSGRRLAQIFHHDRLFTEPGTAPYRLVQMNHYALGAVETFMLKCDRGWPNRSTADGGMGYWVERNFSQVEDRSILDLPSSGLRQELLADPVLNTLHQEAVAWRHARFATLMQEEPWRSLYGCLLMTPPTRMLSREEAQTIWMRPRTSTPA